MEASPGCLADAQPDLIMPSLSLQSLVTMLMKEA